MDVCVCMHNNWEWKGDHAMYKGQLEVCNGVVCIEDGWAAIRRRGDS